MHPDAYDWVADHVPPRACFVLEFGARDTNGTVRDLFPDAVTYIGVDLADGPSVDVVADAADYNAASNFDVVVSTELLEHAKNWPQIVVNAARRLRPGGTFIMTAACDPRRPHGQHGAPTPAAGEHYENVDPAALERILAAWFHDHKIDVLGGDIRAVATKET